MRPGIVRLGIGVITYNRCQQLAATLRALLQNQDPEADCVWVVADDGSTDDTAVFVRSAHPEMALVTGRNRGVTWNRNRALWQLYVVERCDVVILIEDDAFPTEPGWEFAWVSAALTYGHVNLAGEWFSKGFVSGAGTPQDPVCSKGVSGQVSAFSRWALDFVGFYDTRLAGYGMGHVEHSMRMVRAGYGGAVVHGRLGEFDQHQLDPVGVPAPGALPEVLFFLLRSPFMVRFEASHANPETAARNLARATVTVHDQVYRAPWSSDGEMTAFRREMNDIYPGKLVKACDAVDRLPSQLDLVAGQECLSLQDQVALVQIAHETRQSEAGEWAVRTLERGQLLGGAMIDAGRARERA